MLETITTIILVAVGAVTGAGILAYAIYITFYPLAKTVEGGAEVAKHYARAKAEKRAYAPAPRRQLGLTMADGGKKIRQRKNTTK
jgi:uncharacterized membrane protein YdfJ with MMPL/SSD domain